MMTKEIAHGGETVGRNGNDRQAANVSKGKYTTTRPKEQAPHNSTDALAELQRLLQWVAWKLEDDPNRDKPRKVPVNPRTGKNAATNRPASWGTYQQAVDRAKRDDLAGIGFVFTANDPYCGVDLDGCIDDNGNLKPWADGYAHKLNSYTEVSQSGTGLHVIVKATLPGGGRKAQQVEVYDRGRFFVWTGAHVPDSPTVLHERQELIDELLAVHFGVKAKDPATPRHDPQPVNLDDHKLLQLARNAANGAKFERLWSGNVNGYGSQSEADLALCAMLAFWTGGDAQRMNALFQQSELYRPGKWNESHSSDGRTYGKMTIAKAIDGLKASFDPAGRGASCDSSKQETAPDPMEWELISGDWNECPFCAAWYSTMFDGKLCVYHHYCGNKACPVYGKIRLRRMLSAALEWDNVYLTEIDDRDYRTVRDMIDGGYIAAPQADNRVVIATERPTPYSVSIGTETALDAMGTALAAIPDGKRVRRRQVKRERPTAPPQPRDRSLDYRLRPGELKIVLAALDVFGIAYRQYRATFQTVDPLTVDQTAQVKNVFDYLAKQPWGTSSIDTVIEHIGPHGLIGSIDEEWPEPLPHTMREYRLDAARRRYTTRIEVPKSP